MAIEPRRRFLIDAAGIVVAAGSPWAWAAAERKPASSATGGTGEGQPDNGARDAAFAATWEQDGRHFVGVLATRGNRVEVASRQELPSRAHGLAVEPQGTILLAARRPGDWLLRFDPRRGAVTDWDWSEGDYVFNGHVIRSDDGRRLFTTETFLETGEGCVGVRDACSLALLEQWPTGGIDPHELVSGSDGALWVANGGIETRLETGRTKHHLEQMDSSLVRLDAASGRRTGQWRLDDRRLGLRHLALAADGMIGVALQAEHDDNPARQAAPVLALWDRRRGLRPVALPPRQALAGYGGSIAACGGGVAVSCPRAGMVARWQLAGGEARWQSPVLLPQACPLAGGWIGGAGAILQTGGGEGPWPRRLSLDDALRLDNHWALIHGEGAFRRS